MDFQFRLLSIYCTLITLLAVRSHSKKHQNVAPTSSTLLRKSILAPSWEFQGIDHKWKWDQKYKDTESEVLSVFVKEFERSHEFAKNELIMMFGKESMIESRLKPMASIEKELDNDGNRTVKDIYDIVTWRVTFPTVKQLLEAKESFIEDSRFTVAIVKCFGVCLKAGKYAATGYRGISLLAEVDGKPTEIQLVTPYMVMWADWAYNILLQNSTSLRSKKEIIKYAYKLSDYYYNLDASRNKRPACPKSLRNTNMKTVTDAQNNNNNNNKIFESLGSPPSACQFWNDLTVNKNTNVGARRSVLGAVKAHENSDEKGTGKKPSVIDIDKILKPENLKTFGKLKRSLIERPVYYYY